MGLLHLNFNLRGKEMARTIAQYRQKHAKKLARKKVPAKQTVPAGCGMGGSEWKDREQGDINNDGNPNHDQTKWLLI